MPDDTDPLDLIDTDELVEALKRRSAAMVIAMVPAFEDSPTEQGLTFWSIGGHFAVVGLLEQTKHILLVQGGKNVAGD